MLDANDIQKISEIVSRAISENNKVIREDMARQNKELREDMARQNKELREDMTRQNKELREDMAQMKKELREELHEDFMTIIESEVRPQLLLLAEGHEALLEKINRIEKNTEVEGRLDILEKAVKKLNREVAELKKAQ